MLIVRALHQVGVPFERAAIDMSVVELLVAGNCKERQDPRLKIDYKGAFELD